LRLFCGDPDRPDTAVLTSTEGEFGSWGNVFSCYPGFLNGFRLRVEEYQGSADDTATNNIRMYCNSLADPGDFLEGDGLEFGFWRSVMRCSDNEYICGLQTQVEPNQGDGKE